MDEQLPKRSKRIDIANIKPNIQEIESGARGLEILGDQIDRILVFANTIRIYILPTGYFQFEIVKDFSGNPETVATSLD